MLMLKHMHIYIYRDCVKVNCILYIYQGFLIIIFGAPLLISLCLETYLI